MTLNIGDKAPAFSLSDKDGKIHKLADYKGKWVLVYFYPRDNTPGCTKEACAMRDAHKTFSKLNAVVLGISKDSALSHEKFVNKFSLPFTLLSDIDTEVSQLYGVWKKKKFMGREFMGMMRWSFLIDPAGKIAKVYDIVKPSEHAQEVLDDIKNLS